MPLNNRPIHIGHNLCITFVCKFKVQILLDNISSSLHVFIQTVSVLQRARCATRNKLQSSYFAAQIDKPEKLSNSAVLSVSPVLDKKHVLRPQCHSSFDRISTEISSFEAN